MSSPSPEELQRYRRSVENQKTPTRIPNEDFGKLKQDLLTLRADVEETAKTGITAEHISKWQKQYPDLISQRPTLFSIVINPQKDIKMALGMVQILQTQRESKDNDIETANHKLVTYMCDTTGFKQGKVWLEQAESERRQARMKKGRT